MSRDLILRVALMGSDQLSGPLQNVVGASEKGKAAVGSLREEVAKLASQQRSVKSFAQLKREVEETRNAMITAKEKASSLGKQLAHTEKPTKAMRQEFERAKSAAKNMEAAYLKKSQRLNTSRSALAEAGIATKDLAKHERDLATRAKEATAALEKQNKQAERLAAITAKGDALASKGQSLRSSGTSTILKAGAMAAPGFVAAREAMSVESAMGGVAKRVEFKDAAEFKQMTRDLVTLSTRIPMTSQELAEIMAAGADAAIPKEDLLNFTRGAAEMGVAFDISAEKAGQAMATWRTVFNLEQDGVTELGDKINALTSGRGGTADAVTGMVTRVGALGEVSGTVHDEIAAIAHVMSAMSIGEEIGGTAIKNLMVTLGKGEKATRAQQKAFQDLGLNSGQVAKDMQKDASGTITKVLTRIKNLPKSAQTGVLAQLFGTGSVEALAPMLTQLDLLEDNFALIGDNARYAGSMQQEFLDSINNTEGALGLAKNTLKAVNFELGDMLLPTIKQASEKFQEIAESTRKWIQENPEAAASIVKWSSAIIGLVLGLGILQWSLGILLGPIAAVMKHWKLLTTICGVVKGAVVGLATAFGIPVLALLAIGAAVAVVAYLVYKYWDEITAAFQAGVDWILEKGIGGLTAIFVDFSPMGLLYQDFVTLLEWLGIDIPDKLSDIGGAIINGLKNGISNAFPELTAKIKALVAKLPDFVQRFLGVKSAGQLQTKLSTSEADKAAAIERVKKPPKITKGAVAAALAGTGLSTAGLAAPAMASAASVSIGSVTIHVKAAPGENAKEIAAAVQAALKAEAAKAAAAKRSSFKDD